MIIGIVGYPGSGKTAFATLLALEYIKRGKRGVVANWPIYHERIQQINSFKESLDLCNSWVFLDECQQWFGSRNWQQTSDRDLSFFRQARHDGLSLVWLAQAINHVESKLSQDLTTYVWEVRRLFGPNEDEGPTLIERRFGWWAMAVMYDAATFLTPTKRTVLRRRLFRIDHVMHLYDSFAIVGDRTGEGVRAGRRAELASDDASTEPKRFESEQLYGGTVVRLYRSLDDSIGDRHKC